MYRFYQHMEVIKNAYLTPEVWKKKALKKKIAYVVNRWYRNKRELALGKAERVRERRGALKERRCEALNGATRNLNFDDVNTGGVSDNEPTSNTEVSDVGQRSSGNEILI